VAKAPNDTTGQRSVETKAMLRSSGKRHADMQNGNFAAHVAWRQARNNEHDDFAPGLDDVPSNSGRNEFIESKPTRQPKGVKK